MNARWSQLGGGGGGSAAHSPKRHGRAIPAHTYQLTRPDQDAEARRWRMTTQIGADIRRKLTPAQGCALSPDADIEDCGQGNSYAGVRICAMGDDAVATTTLDSPMRRLSPGIPLTQPLARPKLRRQALMPAGYGLTLHSTT